MAISKFLQRSLRATRFGLLIWYLGGPGFSETYANSDMGDFPENLSPGTYLVIGVFSYQDNAEKFTNYVNRQGWTVNYAYYPQTQFYYVYTFTSSSKPSVVDACRELRQNSEFSDAWVFVASPTSLPGDVPSLSSETESDWRSELADSGWDTEIPEELSSAPDEEKAEDQPIIHHPKLQESSIDQSSTLYLKFQTYHALTQEPVFATVKIIDAAQSRSLAETPTRQSQELDKTSIMDSSLQIIPYALGYRKVQFDLPLYLTQDDPIHQYLNWEGDTLLMKMPLPRLKTGDIQIMFDTYFHGNSSVMRERSRYELEELVKLLEENPNMRIKLHGHTNGAGRGYIYSFLPEEKNFFDLRRGKEYKKNGIGSTKLSALRAETIKYYLEHRGISPDRIETVGWGGKKMLYESNSPLAKNNIRVEIEVLNE